MIHLLLFCTYKMHRCREISSQECTGNVQCKFYLFRATIIRNLCISQVVQIQFDLYPNGSDKVPASSPL